MWLSKKHIPITRWRLGQRKGEFKGITPTDKIIEITGVDIDRVVNGKIVEHGGAVNTFDAFWENGLIKPV